MKLIFHKDAEKELNEAVRFYQQQQKGLGENLVEEVYRAVTRIMQHPLAWPILDGKIRRALVRRFPYGVLYQVIENKVYVLAIMHLKQSPEYWKERE